MNSNIKQAKDTALAFTFLFLILFKVFGYVYFFWIAFGICLLAMLVDAPFIHLSKVWFGFSHILGNFVSKIILSLIFYLFLTPIAIIYRITGKDPMYFKDPGKSVFNNRDHQFEPKDLSTPF